MSSTKPFRFLLKFFTFHFLINYSSVDHAGKMKRAFSTSKSYSLLLLWYYQQFDEEKGKNVVLPATPYMIDEAISDFVVLLEHTCNGTFEYDGEDISKNEGLCHLLEGMRTQLLEFQIQWKRSFQKSHVHIFLALFRGFGNGDVAIIPKRNKNPIHFTSRFGWQTVGLWYLVSYSSCISSTFFIYFLFFSVGLDVYQTSK